METAVDTRIGRLAWSMASGPGLRRVILSANRKSSSRRLRSCQVSGQLTRAAPGSCDAAGLRRRSIYTLQSESERLISTLKLVVWHHFIPPLLQSESERLIL